VHLFLFIHRRYAHLRTLSNVCRRLAVSSTVSPSYWGKYGTMSSQRTRPHSLCSSTVSLWQMRASLTEFAYGGSLSVSAIKKKRKNHLQRQILHVFYKCLPIHSCRTDTVNTRVKCNVCTWLSRALSLSLSLSLALPLDISLFLGLSCLPHALLVHLYIFSISLSVVISYKLHTRERVGHVR